MPRIAKLLLFLFLASPAGATTHYISSSTGLDTNTAAQATSKTTPWAHLPGMANATSNAASYVAAAGDQFILMGCDSWYNASFPLAITHGGASGNPVIITIDQTWFNTTACPSGWNRPIFDAHTSAASSTPMEINGTGGQATGCVGNDGNFFMAFHASNVTVSWIEMRNLYWANDAQNTCYGSNGWWAAHSVDFVIVSHSYESSWSMHAYQANTFGDVDIAIEVDGTPSCPHCFVDYNVADNCATHPGPTNLPGGAIDFVNITHSIFKCMSNAIKPIFPGEIGWNEVTKNGNSPDATVHENVLESVSVINGTYYIHDNRFHDYWAGEGLQIGNPGETDYVWNNSWYGLLQVGANGPQVPQSETPVAFYYWNNTIVDWGDCVNDANHGYTWSGAFQSRNNLCINSAGNAGSGSPNSTPAAVIGNNLGMTDSAATAAGYTSSQTRPFSPTLATSASVGFGANLTSIWPAGFPTVDASLICSEQTVSGVVQAVCTGTPIARPTTGAWASGAFQFAGNQPAPNPPTNFRVVSIQ